MKPTKAATLVALMMVPLLAFRFGGWAVITVDTLPAYLTAGAPTPLNFVVRQHGMTPLPGLHPTVVLTSGRTELTFAATPGRLAGQYSSTITPPAAGEWTVRIISGFMNVENTLLPLRAVPAGGAAPRLIADADVGHQLFVAKGCVTCHMRGETGGKMGPDLTIRRYAVAAVSSFLADPENSPLSRSGIPNGVRMPNLNLSQREIGTLVAYLNSEAVVGTASRR
jgi:mono/diheme cytochrome c family protein